MAVSSASVSGFRSLRLISVILSDCPFNPDFGIFSRRFKWRASGVSGIERLRHEAAEEEKGIGRFLFHGRVAYFLSHTGVRQTVTIS